MFFFQNLNDLCSIITPISDFRQTLFNVMQLIISLLHNIPTVLMNNTNSAYKPIYLCIILKFNKNYSFDITSVSSDVYFTWSRKRWNSIRQMAPQVS